MNQVTDTGSTPDSSASVTPPAPAEARPRTSILLVDDQPARLLTYEAVLSGVDVECVRALSSRDALKLLLTREFALILLDVNMPEMDGFETARLIREHPRWERTPIIFVTGMNVSDLDQLKGYEVGAIDYISIPVVPEILRTKVTVLVELHQRRRHLETLNDSLTQARSELEIRHANALAERDAQLHAIFEHPTELFMVLQAVRDPSETIVDFQYSTRTRTHWNCSITRAASCSVVCSPRCSIPNTPAASSLNAPKCCRHGKSFVTKRDTATRTFPSRCFQWDRTVSSAPAPTSPSARAQRPRSGTAKHVYGKPMRAKTNSSRC